MAQPEQMRFWQVYLATLPKDHPHRFQPLPDAWRFGDGPEMVDELGKLVLDGTKTATCSRYTGENILDDAGLSLLLAGDGRPLCLVETYEITIRHFCDVDAEFAAAEGEGDLSLEGWRDAHRRFFSLEGKEEGYDVSEEMLLSCERFRVLYQDGAAR